jgi:cyanate lyase/DNA-binding transcriptional regulator YhcF (GntR family)
VNTATVLNESYFRKSFRDYLSDVFLERLKKNPKYSIRAFARSIEIDQSLLSKYLNRKRNLSEQSIRKIGQKLGLDDQTVSKFLPFKTRLDQESRFKNLSEDTFEIMAQWHYFALMELTEIEDVKSVKDMSDRLGMDLETVIESLKKLQYVGLLDEDENGKWFQTEKDLSWANTTSTSEARRIYQKRILLKAVQAIDEVGIDERDNTSIVLACDKKLLPVIRQEFAQFRSKLNQYVQDNGNYTDVFQLCMAFYPLTQNQDQP